MAALAAQVAHARANAPAGAARFADWARTAVDSRPRSLVCRFCASTNCSSGSAPP
jgi:hypothetical protein